MAKISRIGDACTGVCSHPSHVSPIPMTGVISIVSQSTVTAEGALVSTVGDTVIGLCGHIGIITSSPGKATIGGKKITTIGATYAGIFAGAVTGGCGTSDT